MVQAINSIKHPNYDIRIVILEEDETSIKTVKLFDETEDMPLNEFINLMEWVSEQSKKISI